MYFCSKRDIRSVGVFDWWVGIYWRTYWCVCAWVYIFLWLLNAVAPTLGKDKIAQNLRIIMFELQYKWTKEAFNKSISFAAAVSSIEFFFLLLLFSAVQSVVDEGKFLLEPLHVHVHSNNRAVSWKHQHLPPITCLFNILSDVLLAATWNTARIVSSLSHSQTNVTQSERLLCNETNMS